MIWRFTLHLKEIDSFTDEQAGALYGGCCSDGTLSSSAGRAWIGFDREAPTLQDAIRSAVADVRQAGLEVDHVEIEEQELVEEELAQWQTA
ncbi:MAG: hypothetical protein AABP62_29730 [Planctomycetota bacterium]